MSDFDIGTGPIINSSTALEAVTRGEVDIQIATAKRFPRSITAFQRDALALATLDQETAESMFYSLPPRDREKKKRIEGPSVRMAEVVLHTWGNMRVDARIASIDDEFITAVGTAFDLERNIATRHEVKRRIVDSRGKRYSADMIQVTGNAASSIAIREAIFKAVPRALFKSVSDAAKETALGKSKSMAERREAALGWFERQGVARSRILESLGRRGVDDLSVDDLMTLSGRKTAVREGDVSLDDAFPVEGDGAGEKASAAADRLAQAAEANRAARAQAAPELDAVGLTDAPLPADDGPERTSAETAFLRLVMDTPRGTGGKPAADDAQRARLLTLAETMEAGMEPAAATRLRELAADPKLASVQARTLVLHAADANLIERPAAGGNDAR